MQTINLINMKWSFVVIKFIQLGCLLSCGGLVNSEDLGEGSLNGTASTVYIRPTSTVVVTMNASKMPRPSQRTNSLPNHKTFVNATSTNDKQSMSVNSTTTRPPTLAPMKVRDSNLGLIIGIIVAVLVALAVVVCFVTLYRRWKILPYACARSPMHVRGAALGTYEDIPYRGLASPTLFYSDVTEKEDPILMWKTKKRRSKTVSVHPDLVKKLITVDGGVMEIDGITLKFGPGCLAQDTEITLIRDDRNLAFKTLLKLGLINAIPQVIECLPDGLKFLKPAWLTVRFETTICDEELFILHGSYNRDFQKTIWKLVPNDVEEKSVDGEVNVQINEFCFYCFISATRSMIARILSHLNQSFTARAYSLYRRLGTSDMIDISVVLISEFVDTDNEENIKQLKDHYDEGYTKGERGMLKRVDTDRHFEMFLDFLEVDSTPVSFKVDQPQLDSVGFVIDDFKGIFVKHPANGSVKVHEVTPTENRLLWSLSVREIETMITCQEQSEEFTEPDYIPLEEFTEPDYIPLVVYRTTKLTNREISQMSKVVGVEWNGLAGLMDIPYSEREEIRKNQAMYPDSFSKAEKIFLLFNDREDFCRRALEKWVEELNLHDVKKEMLNIDENEELSSPPLASPNEKDVAENTPLSPREMSRLSRKISSPECYKLAAIMGISSTERENIRSSSLYSDECSYAEKFLSIYNRKKNFSRKALGDGLSEIQKLDLVEPIMTGQWRSL